MPDRRMVWKTALLWALFASVPFVAIDADAQTAVQIPLQFDFINPGAKSLALGTAFVGMADDATAGFANPAGLRELSRPEVSLEVRGRRLTSLFLERGRLSGAVQNEGTDTIAGPVFGESRDSNVGLSYLAAVYASPRRRWVVAAFRHELARVDQVSLSQGVYQQVPGEFTSTREFPQEGIRRITITSYAVAGAVELNPRMAVGGTLNLYTFELDSQFLRFRTDGFLGPPILTMEVGRSTQKGEDLSITPTVGFRACLKRCDDRSTAALRGGIVYRHGPTFEFDTQDGPNQRTSRFRVPHVLAAGAALEVPQEGRRLLFMVDVTRITHSRIVKDFVTDQALAQGVESNLFVNDGTEIHAGFQYTAEGSKWLPRYRGGIWIDPDHSVRYRVTTPAVTAEPARSAAVVFLSGIFGFAPPAPPRRLTDELMGVALSTGKRTVHYAGGLGVTLNPRTELNVGADVASRVWTISTSLILKLGQ